MRFCKAKIILLTSFLAIFNIQPSTAISNGTPAPQGLTVKLISNWGSCSGAVWKINIVITAAHCVFDTTGVLREGLSVNAFRNGVWSKIEVAGIKAPTDYKSANSLVDLNSQNLAKDIAFIILKNNLGDPATFSGPRFANTSDWETFKLGSTGFAIYGYGYTSETDFAANQPVAGIFTLDQTYSQGNKDWAVLRSNVSATCHGDSGGPVVAYSQIENAFILVGVLQGGVAVGNCSYMQSNGGSINVIIKLSFYNDLAKSTELTQAKYLVGKYALDTAFTKLDKYKTKLSDLSDFADQLSPSSKKRIYDNNKDVIKLNGYLDDFETKVNDQEEILNQSMEFTYINSGVLEANAPAVGTSFEASFKPFVTKIDPLFTKISKTLPSFVCTSDSLIKDLPSSKKCPKGYTKIELTKPF
jgi:hypothetical protein